MSAMICVQYGPITMAVRSMTRRPDNGPFILSPPFALYGVSLPRSSYGKPYPYSFVELISARQVFVCFTCFRRTVTGIKHGFLAHRRPAKYPGRYPEAVHALPG